jgi:hypothetical protein
MCFYDIVRCKVFCTPHKININTIDFSLEDYLILFVFITFHAFSYTFQHVLRKFQVTQVTQCGDPWYNVSLYIELFVNCF